VRGHELDLTNLAIALQGSDDSIGFEDGLYWLRSKSFDGLHGDPNRARAKAEELLALLRGVAKANVPGFDDLELGACVDWLAPDGRLKRRLTDTFTLKVRSASRIEDGAEALVVERKVSRWLSVARRGGHVSDALKLWADRRPNDWQTLYKVVEIIKDSARPKLKMWVSQNELSLFRRTACSPSAIGHAARHGVQEADPPATPMTIKDAEELVQRLLRCWIETQN
jgi:hypothetical protein